MKFTCPCCGYKSLEGNKNTCKVCDWINDPYQAMDPDQTVGPNAESLRWAQFHFKGSKKTVSGFEKDTKWCAFAAPVNLANSAGLVIKYFNGKYSSN